MNTTLSLETEGCRELSEFTPYVALVDNGKLPTLIKHLSRELCKGIESRTYSMLISDIQKGNASEFIDTAFLPLLLYEIELAGL